MVDDALAHRDCRACRRRRRDDVSAPQTGLSSARGRVAILDAGPCVHRSDRGRRPAVALRHADRRFADELLYVAFDLTILSGLFGVIAYVVAPRIMTRIEGEPLLVEDLEKRREELRQDTRKIYEKSEGWLKEELRDRVYPRFLSYGFLWRQICRREELKALLAQARQEFKERTTRTTTEDERDLLIAAVEAAVTLRRVDALLALHWLLRVWIPMHIVSTALMLALMVVHVGQVVFFNVQ